jgi:hypothetical protein
VQLLGAAVPPTPPVNGLTSEAAVQQAVRLETARRGARLWRNNVGAMVDDTGRLVRFGLGHDSSAVNKIFKSSDLIGITPTRCACGATHGLFTAYEIKRPGWHLTPGDQRAQAQLAFLKLVVALGGVGRFVTSLEDLG